MSRPLVSFLTTAYRTEPYLGAAIDSVRAQTRADWQLVVVDNGNSDAIASIVDRYRDDPRIVLLRQDNKGYCGGVAAATAAATGEFISVFDSDDLLEPSFVERVADVVDSVPGVAAIGCDAELFYDPEHLRPPEDYFRSIGRKSPPSPNHSAGVMELMDEGVPGYTGAVRRDVWELLDGYSPAETGVEPDVVLWLRMAARGLDIRILADKLVRFRQRPHSESRDPGKIRDFEHRLQKSFIAGGLESGLTHQQIADTGMLRRLRYQQALRCAREAFLTGQPELSRRCARMAFDQRHTLRATLVLAGLQLSPTLLAAVHPLKSRATERFRRHLACSAKAQAR